MTRSLIAPPRGTPSVRAGRRLGAALASLRLAVVLLSLLAVCLAGATWIESTHGARVAQQLVYRAWWFDLLLGLLAVNVLAAAVKKFPWRRHQTGFLVTHAGLLVLLFGGLLTALFGVEGQVVLVDTPRVELHRRLGLSDSGSSMYLDGLDQLDVFRLWLPPDAAPADAARLARAVDGGLAVPPDLRTWVDGEWSLPLEPGVFTWATDEYAARRLPWTLDLLDRLASPAPGFVTRLDGRTALTVANFYPDVEPDPQHPLGFVPRAMPMGGDRPRNATAGLRGTLTVDGAAREFIVARFHAAVRLRLGERLYLIRYRSAERPLGFTLTLQRAWQVRDPGSDRPAGFQSDVVLASGAEVRPAAVSMNQTLGHGLYKVYQANYRQVVDPRTGEPVLDGERPVSVSGLTVAHDPGLWLKYLGSLTVAAGIAVMFWMKAYFFAPRRPAARS